MPDDAVIVNVARGGIVDESALVDALDTQTIRGAALDVASEEPLPDGLPLWDREDVLITPYVAEWSPDYWRDCAAPFANNYRRFAVGDRTSVQNRIRD